MGEFTETVFCCSNKIPEVRYVTQTSYLAHSSGGQEAWYQYLMSVDEGFTIWQMPSYERERAW